MLGQGVFEYWGSGRQFHAKVQLPPALGMTRFEEAASDGNEYRFFIADDGLLSVHGADHRRWILPNLNPLFLPFLFLDPADDESETVPELRLIDFRAARPRSTQRKVAPSGETIAMSRRKVWGRELAQVRVATWKGARGMEMALEQQEADGTRMARTEMKNWNPVPGALDLSFPWTLAYTVYDETGTWALVHTTFLIEEIRASPSLPDDVFRLNPAGVRHVWDEAKREFIY